MVSLASTNRTRISHISAVLSSFPGLAAQTIKALDLPSQPPDYRPLRFEAHFNGRLVLLVESNQIIYEARKFPLDYRPMVITLYGDSELLFVRVGPEVLLNRLPVTYTPAWKTYDIE